MEPVLVVLDVQALQPGSGADEPTRARVGRWAGAWAQAGRLVCALLAPEFPAPDSAELPPELAGAGPGLVRWDTRAEARRLVESSPRIVHHLPAPLLHTGPGAPAGIVVSRHWAESGVPRVVSLARDQPEPVSERLAARLEWVSAAALILMEDDGPGPSGHVVHLGHLPCGDPDVWDRAASVVAARLDSMTGRRGPEPASMPRRVALFGPFPPGGGGIGAYNGRLVEAAAAAAAAADPSPAAAPPATAGPNPAVGPAPAQPVAPAPAAPGRPAEIDAVTTAGIGWHPPAGVALVHAESFGTDVRAASYDAVVYTVGNSDGHLATIEAALRYPGWVWLHEARLPAVATTALAHLDDTGFDQHLSRLLERAYPARPPLAAARAAGRSHLALASAGVGLTALLAEKATGILVNSAAARHALLLDLPPLAWHPPVVVLPPACPPVRPRRPAAPEDPTAAKDPAAAPAPTAAKDPATPAEDPVAVAFGVVSMGKRPDLLVDAAARAGCRLAFVGPCPDILAMVIRDRARHLGVADRVEVVGAVDDDGWWGWMQRAAVAVQLRDTRSGEMSAAVLDGLAAGLPVLTNLASAAEYPEGTLEFLEGSEPDTVAAAIERLLADPARREALSAGAQKFAAAHQMADLVVAVMAAILG